MFTLVLESNQTGKRLWNEEEKIAQKPAKCKKKKKRKRKPTKNPLSCEDLIYWRESHALGKGKSL